MVRHFLLLISSLLLATPSLGWTGSPPQTQLSTDSGSARLITSDGQGGVLAAWISNAPLPGTFGEQINCQRLDERGNAQWPSSGSSGVSATLQNDMKRLLHVVPDGSGGAILVWNQVVDPEDLVEEQLFGIYAQKVNADGSRAWGDNGVSVVEETAKRIIAPKASHAVPDGEGGVIVVWSDIRMTSGTSMTEVDVYCQRVSAEGQLLWQSGGHRLSSISGEYPIPVVVSDGSGGGIFAWAGPHPTSSDRLLFAQRVNAQGSEVWVPGGQALSSQILPPGAHVSSRILGISDAAGVATFVYSVKSVNDGDPQEQKLNVRRIGPDGLMLWPEGPGFETPESQVYPLDIVTDQNDGVFVTYVGEARISFEAHRHMHLTRLHSGAQLWDQVLEPCDSSFAGDASQGWLAGDGAGGVFAAWFYSTEPDNPCKIASRFGPEGQTLWSSMDLPRMFGVAAMGGGRAAGIWQEDGALFATPLPPWSFIAKQQQLKIQPNGVGYQELFYNYATTDLSVSPYQAAETSVPYRRPYRQPFGIFHYDYGTARFSEAVYLLDGEF